MKHLYIVKGTLVSRDDVLLYKVLAYLAIMRLDELGWQEFWYCHHSCSHPPCTSKVEYPFQLNQTKLFLHVKWFAPNQSGLTNCYLDLSLCICIDDWQICRTEFVSLIPVLAGGFVKVKYLWNFYRSYKQCSLRNLHSDMPKRTGLKFMTARLVSSFSFKCWSR